MRERPNNAVRALLGMVGTDVHSKGIRTLAHVLREAGVDVVYMGEHNSVEAIARAAVEEDADLVGLSFSSSAYLAYTQQLMDVMKDHGADHIPVMIGGIIHPDDHAPLSKMGVKGIFGAGSKIEDIIAFVQAQARTP